MKVRASYREGHLVVAAIRILAHKSEGRPPTIDDIAGLVGMSGEWTGVLVKALATEGIVRQLTGPFETRVEVGNHGALEELPHEDAASTVNEDLKEFAEKKRQEDEKLRHLFSSDALAKQKKKISRFEEDLKKFQSKKPRSSLFDDLDES